MKLEPMVITKDEGTAYYAVEFQGQTYAVNPGQERIKINGVNFQIDTTGYAPEIKVDENGELIGIEELPEEESSDNQTRDWPEPEEAPKPKKSRKSKK